MTLISIFSKVKGANIEIRELKHKVGTGLTLPGLTGPAQDLSEVKQGMETLKSLVMSSVKGSVL